MLAKAPEAGRIDQIIEGHLFGEEPQALHPQLPLGQGAVQIRVGGGDDHRGHLVGHPPHEFGRFSGLEKPGRLELCKSQGFPLRYSIYGWLRGGVKAARIAALCALARVA